MARGARVREREATQQAQMEELLRSQGHAHRVELDEQQRLREKLASFEDEHRRLADYGRATHRADPLLVHAEQPQPLERSGSPRGSSPRSSEPAAPPPTTPSTTTSSMRPAAVAVHAASRLDSRLDAQIRE